MKITCFECHKQMGLEELHVRYYNDTSGYVCNSCWNKGTQFGEFYLAIQRDRDDTKDLFTLNSTLSQYKHSCEERARYCTNNITPFRIIKFTINEVKGD